MPACFLIVAFGIGAGGCANDTPKETAKRNRWDEIVNPTGSGTKDVHSKRSRYDGMDFQSKDVKTRSYTGGKKRWEGQQDFNIQAYQKKNPLGERSPYERKESAYADDTARTFQSRYQNQPARTKDYAQADTKYRTSKYREGEKKYAAGEEKYDGPGARLLKPTQLGRSATETQNAFAPDKHGELDQEAIRRVLNKGPRPE